MYKLIISIGLLLATWYTVSGQNMTDVSLFMRSDSAYTNEVSSESGDLFLSIGHHGPAIENEWMALRIYFDFKSAIDVYSKEKPQLVLKKTKWYPSEAQQEAGWGADYYKAGTTVGLGGIRLWNNGQEVFLNPVSKRTARVVKESNMSYMEMRSEGLAYGSDTVDILVRVSVFSGSRNATVEAFALTDKPVQFATGINYHKGTELHKEDGLFATWGVHPEDVASRQLAIGGALLFSPEDYAQTLDDGKQMLLISKPCKQLKTTISATSALDQDLNTMTKFLAFLNDCKH